MTKEKFLKITEYLGGLVKGTQYEGHIFAVGGSVRDYVMGNEIKDIDLVVDLDNGGVAFAEYLYDKGETTSTVVVYPNFGTAMFRLKEFPDDDLEAVYTRGEKYVEGSRNPKTNFATIDDDCFRRDLTINALYYNVSTKEILDLTGKGLKDIEEHTIRVTNDNADIVFKDDPLRILRVVRFASRYGWEIESETYQSMRRNIDGLGFISQERITAEFSQMLVCENVDMALGFIKDLDCYNYVTGGTCGNGELYVGSIKLAKSLPNKLELRLAALTAFSDDAEKTMRAMKYPNDVVETVTLFHCLRSYSFWNYRDMPYIVSRLQYECGCRELFDDAVDFVEAERKNRYADGYGEYYTDYFKNFRKLGLGKDMYKYKLPIDGNEVMDYLNIQPSATVGRIMGELLELAFENNGLTKDECLEYINDKFTDK